MQDITSPSSLFNVSVGMVNSVASAAEGATRAVAAAVPHISPNDLDLLFDPLQVRVAEKYEGERTVDEEDSQRYAKHCH